MAFRKTALRVVMAATTLSSSVAMAQEAPEGRAADSAASGEGDIVVTAQRREERLVDVPISVSAVGTAALDRAQVSTVTDLATVVPNIQINETIGNTYGPLITIRGLSPSADTSLARDQPVGLYIDGVPIGKSTGAAFDTVDLERVEVLRGPQGTLFGKNTTAGAILVTTRKPSFTPEHDFELGVGQDDFVQAKGSVSGPLGENVAGRVSVSSTQRDGLLYDVASQERVNDLDNVGVRTQLLVTPNERISSDDPSDHHRRVVSCPPRCAHRPVPVGWWTAGSAPCRQPCATHGFLPFPTSEY